MITLITPATASAPYIADDPSLKTSILSIPFTGKMFEFTELTGTKLPPTDSD